MWNPDISKAPPEKITQYFRYDPEDGHFYRLKPLGTRRNRGVGCRADECTDSHGYPLVKFENRRYLAHRLAWFFFFGEWPKKHIDHINRVRADNRIANLRKADRSQNNTNRDYDTSLARGVKRSGNKFQAKICWRCVTYYLGQFDTVEQASAAYENAAKRLHGEFAQPGLAALKDGIKTVREREPA